MNENKIQLGKFLKRENWELHYAFSEEPGQSWIFCFQKVCEESQLNPGLKYFSSVGIELGKQNYFAAIVYGLNDSEDTLRSQLEQAIKRTNEIQNDPIVAEYYNVQRKIAVTPDVPNYVKAHLESRRQELENKLRETGTYKFVTEEAVLATA